jgi:transposase-like protein
MGRPPKAANAERRSKQPPAVRARAVDLFTKGHAMQEIAKAVGVDVSTIYRWCKAASAVHGSALVYAPPAQDVSEILNPVSFESIAKQEVQVSQAEKVLQELEQNETPTQRMMNATEIMGAIEEAMAKPGDTSDRYQAIMVAMGLNVLKQAAAMPPPVKTMRDLATLNDILRTNLGLNAKGGAGGLAINLNILTKGGGLAKNKGQTIVVDAEFDEEDE